MIRTTRRIAWAIAILAVSACAEHPRTELTTAENATECVVLLHGLNRSWRAMRPMAQALQQAGFATVNVDYPSQSGTIEEIAPIAVGMGLGSCRATGATKIHFVTHSMGGILLRYQQKHDPAPELGRVVMLGPPNQGSSMIDRTRDWPGFEWVSGEAGAQLGTDENSVPLQLGPVDFELGIIAGTGTVNIFMSAMMPEDNDGKVTVLETRVEGMDDFLIVGKSHRYITRGDVVIRNTESFLRDGHFLDRDRSLELD